MLKRYEVRRVTDIRKKCTFYEIWEVFEIDGEERRHRKSDVAFNTETEAQAWISAQRF